MHTLRIVSPDRILRCVNIINAPVPIRTRQLSALGCHGEWEERPPNTCTVTCSRRTNRGRAYYLLYTQSTWKLQYQCEALIQPQAGLFTVMAHVIFEQDLEKETEQVGNAEIRRKSWLCVKHARRYSDTAAFEGNLW